jgi:hypothetical protein
VCLLASGGSADQFGCSQESVANKDVGSIVKIVWNQVRRIRFKNEKPAVSAERSVTSTALAISLLILWSLRNALDVAGRGQCDLRD